MDKCGWKKKQLRSISVYEWHIAFKIAFEKSKRVIQPFRKWTDLLIDSISIRAIQPFRKCTDMLTDSYFENENKEKLNSMKKIISKNYFIFDFYMDLVTIIALGSIEIVQTLITGSAGKASLEKEIQEINSIYK